eukprot:gnl/TRDRNA2_/TRDRNA2_124872_c1_seq1.p1 gnl/TRDRNA2_/TRDRNA2_124872_c1~~gnl/TRDRNA2_/TRDRNA2_124872_c1_seq1.p1  ORF type:complete len:125 (+),score=7.10 gnl/TRDRNA2_/TRDRNA2_124872_c1_seq1:47-376(+)
MLASGALALAFNDITTTRFLFVCVATGFLLTYYASPFSTLTKVVKERSSASLYPPMSTMIVVNAGLCIAYGLALDDLFIAVPNGIGAALGSIQLLLCLFFPAERNTRLS